MALGERSNEPGSHPVPAGKTFTQAKKAAFLVALAKTGSLVGAASRVSVHPSTVYDHAQKDPSFTEAIERARGEWEQATLEVIENAARSGKVIERRTPSGKVKEIEPGDWRAAAWLIEHTPHTRERYAALTKGKVEISGDPDGEPLRVKAEVRQEIDIGPDTMERLARVVQVLIRSGKLALPDIIPGEATEVDD